jgi:putative transposase
LKVGSEYIWLWVAIESETRQILALSISKERNMLIAKRFIRYSQDSWKTSSFYRWWYLVSPGLQVSKLKSPYYSSMEKSLIEREPYSISEG